MKNKAHSKYLCSTTYRKGLVAEFVCRTALRLKGYRIIFSRYRSGLGEIDIVAVRGKTLAFVEVKARASKDKAVESISRRQQERLNRAAQDFLARHPRFATFNIRFDAMLMAPWRWPTHIPNAWSP